MKINIGDIVYLNKDKQIKIDDKVIIIPKEKSFIVCEVYDNDYITVETWESYPEIYGGTLDLHISEISK